MNFVAHLFLAQPTPDSYFGNLLGDFRRGVDINDYAKTVQAGVANHVHVDKFTDNHTLVKEARTLFSSQRRRFGGIILDVLFDHFLLKHWHQYSEVSFEKFSRQVYQRLDARVDIMPPAMQGMVSSMLEHQWLGTYKQLTGVERALERTASRIRFQHQFDGSIEEVIKHYEEFERTFLMFFPELVNSVKSVALELPDPR